MKLLSLDLLLKNVLQSHGISRKLGDTLTQLLGGHGVLVQVEPEQRLVDEVRLAGDVQVRHILAGQLLGHAGGRVVQVLQQVGRDGQVVAAGQLGDLTSVPERRAHDNGLVAVLLVVVEDGLHRLDTGVFIGSVLLLVVGLEPVKDPTNEGRDEVGAGLSTGNGLDGREDEGQVAVDAVLALKDVGSLDTLPGGGDLDEDAVLGDALRFVEL